VGLLIDVNTGCEQLDQRRQPGDHTEPMFGDVVFRIRGDAKTDVDRRAP